MWVGVMHVHPDCIAMPKTSGSEGVVPRSVQSVVERQAAPRMPVITGEIECSVVLRDGFESEHITISCSTRADVDSRSVGMRCEGYLIIVLIDCCVSSIGPCTRVHPR